MSYFSLLKMRCRILEFTQSQQDGMTYQSWTPIFGGDKVHCFLDLGFIRAGKDPVWTPDTNTAQNRSGVLFLPPNCKANPGNRIQMLRGPGGTFEITSSLDEAWRPDKLHHLECFVQEVDRVLAGT